MILSTGRDPGRLGMKILIAHNECANDCAAGRLVRKLKGELEENGVAVLSAQTAFDAEMLLASDPMIQALLLAWDLDDELSHGPSRCGSTAGAQCGYASFSLHRQGKRGADSAGNAADFQRFCLAVRGQRVLYCRQGACGVAPLPGTSSPAHVRGSDQIFPDS